MDRVPESSDEDMEAVARQVAHDAKEIAEQAGDVADLIHYVKRVGEELPEGELTYTNDQVIVQLSGSISDQFRVLSRPLNQMRSQMGTISFTAITYANTAATTMGEIASLTKCEPPSLQELTREIDRRLERPDIVNKLRALRPDLANKYEQVWQLVSIPGEDQARPAMAEARQLWDELFSYLAPDEAVKAQPWWSLPESRGKPDQVIRPERMRYVLETRVKDSLKKAALEPQVSAHCSIRKKLDDFHRRGGFNTALGLSVVKEILSVLHQWLDAIDT